MNKTVRIIAVTLLILLGISAIYGGGAFILDPSGKLIGMPVSHLEHSPFDSFLIPGLILFLFNGVSSLVIAVITLKRNNYAPILIMLQGIVQVIWIIVQVAMIRSTSALHYICFTVGVLLIISGYKLYKEMRHLKK